MRPRVVTISPQGQLTIPTKLRKHLRSRKYVLELHDEVIVMKPCRVVMKAKDSFVKKEIVDKVLALEGHQKAVYSCIHKEPCSADDIASISELSISTINVVLCELEFEGLITRGPGALWVASLAEHLP